MPADSAAISDDCTMGAVGHYFVERWSSCVAYEKCAASTHRSFFCFIGAFATPVKEDGKVQLLLRERRRIFKQVQEEYMPLFQRPVVQLTVAHQHIKVIVHDLGACHITNSAVSLEL